MMKNHQFAAFLLVCACIFPEIMLLAAKTSDKFCLNGRYTVHVVNKLPDQMKVHCRSKDDDLEDHFLNPNEYYNFSFCDNILGRTLFSCQLWWGNKEVGFKAFTSGDHRYQCLKNQCFWEGRSDGIYGSSYEAGGFIKRCMGTW
ncbi:hypothetical protein ACS0TY_019123 [Phlomoides rotata]